MHGASDAIPRSALVDTVALAATIGGSAVGLAGVCAAAWGAWLQRESAKEVATAQHEHERELARGERLLERRAVAYEALVEYLQIWWERIADTEPILRVDGGASPPDPPTPEESRAMNVRLRTYGSRTIADLFSEFTVATLDFFVQARLLRSIRERPGTTPEPWEEVEAARRKVAEIHVRILDAVSDELASL